MCMSKTVTFKIKLPVRILVPKNSVVSYADGLMTVTFDNQDFEDVTFRLIEGILVRKKHENYQAR